jgi:hypothetical protein
MINCILYKEENNGISWNGTDMHKICTRTELSWDFSWAEWSSDAWSTFTGDPEARPKFINFDHYREKNSFSKWVDEFRIKFNRIYIKKTVDFFYHKTYSNSKTDIGYRQAKRILNRKSIFSETEYEFFCQNGNYINN